VCTLLTTFDGLTLVVAKILIKQNCPSFPQLSQYFMNLHRLLHEVTESTHKRDPSCHPSQRQFATHLKYNSTSSDTQLDRVLEACLIPNPNRIRTGSGPDQDRIRTGSGPDQEPSRAGAEAGAGTGTEPAPNQDPPGTKISAAATRPAPRGRSIARAAQSLERGACPAQARRLPDPGTDPDPFGLGSCFEHGARMQAQPRGCAALNPSSTSE
jgi:hypothetical protein